MAFAISKQVIVMLTVIYDTITAFLGHNELITSQ